MILLDTVNLLGLSTAARHPYLSLAAVLALSLAILVALAYPIREARLPYRNLPGPKPTSFFWGNMQDIIKAPPNAMQETWIREHGQALRYRVMFGRPRLCISDTTAIAYMMQHTYDFVKLKVNVRGFNIILGMGVLTAEGAVHRRQRRILNPAFGAPAVKAMQDIFLDMAYELEHKLETLLEGSEATSPTPPKPEDVVSGIRKVDVLKYMGQMTLDVIGLAGFNYDFHALGHQKNELSSALHTMITQGQQRSPLAILQFLFPVLKFFPSKIRSLIREGRAKSLAISQAIFQARKEQVQSEMELGEKVSEGKDLLSRVVRSNMDPSLRADQTMTEDEVVAQITTFMIAGNETTSTALTWCLYRLAQNLDVQNQLRAECRSIGERPSIDELNALPLLEKVVHESLRLDSPVPQMIRCAVKDHVVPLGTPVIGRDGSLIDSIHIPAGTDVFFPLLNVNHSTEIWGADAHEFHPFRSPAKTVPGVYGNLLTFYGGARNCMYRFALAEMKATLFVLMRSLEFLPLPSAPTIRGHVQVVMRPLVVGEEDAGLQLPLLVRVASEE